MSKRLTVLVLFGLLAVRPIAAQEQHFADLGTCTLESGAVLEECRIGYRTIGALSADGSNAILVPSWYGGSTANWLELQAALLGEDHDYLVILVDALANGVSVSPSNSVAQPGSAFPDITTRDMVHTQYRLATEVLGLERLHAVMGISMGGMQTFEWAVLYPDFMEKLVPIAGSPRLAGHDVALWESYKRLLSWGVACQCDEAAEAMSALMLLNSTTSDQAGVDLPGDSVRARVARSSTNRMQAGSAMNLIRQADAMIATDAARSFTGDWAAAAGAVRAEMLIIVGASDHVVTPGAAIEFGRHLGDRATTIVFENDCGHNIPGCEMFRSRSLIREFLRAAPRPGSS
ncbi:MAG: alpha/beta fold hydrolase [Gemmatimonadetes bacterium]|nr:alpha/beta fold hydrolase [Gemmatimonadota bacterium]MDA1104555.1 alpha/beta fold hydrolase [Gemmatimonadota bacterium]